MASRLVTKYCVGRALAQLRESATGDNGKPLTQRGMAERSGIGHSAYLTYEQGSHMLPLDRAYILAQTFDIGVDELIALSFTFSPFMVDVELPS